MPPIGPPNILKFHLCLIMYQNIADLSFLSYQDLLCGLSLQTGLLDPINDHGELLKQPSMLNNAMLCQGIFVIKCERSLK